MVAKFVDVSISFVQRRMRNCCAKTEDLYWYD